MPPRATGLGGSEEAAWVGRLGALEAGCTNLQAWRGFTLPAAGKGTWKHPLLWARLLALALGEGRGSPQGAWGLTMIIPTADSTNECPLVQMRKLELEEVSFPSPHGWDLEWDV